MVHRFGSWTLALLLVGCGTKTKTTTTTPPVVADEASDAAKTPAEGQAVVTGQLRAHDGTALRAAEISIRRDGFPEPQAHADLDAEGRFRLEVPAGVYSISIAAVDHAQVVRRTVLDGTVEVHGELGTYARSESGETIPIVSALVDAEGNRVAPGPQQATRVEGSVYRIAVPAERPPEATALRYQLRVTNGSRTFNGPTADRFVSDHGGDYFSVVDLADRDDAIDLDLAALAPAGESSSLTWTGEDATTAALLAFEKRFSQPLDDLLRSLPRKDGTLRQTTDAHLEQARRIEAQAQEVIDQTEDPDVRILLRAAKLARFGPFVYGPDDADARREEAAWVIEHLPPDEVRIALLYNLDNVLFVAARDADDAFRERAEAWYERRANDNPDAGTALEALAHLLYAADQRRDQDRVAELYARLDDPRFEGNVQRMYLEQQFDPDRPLQTGKPVPTYDFGRLHDASKRITRDGQTGKLYLLEFWATWCGPCVREMPETHRAYAAINGARLGKSKTKTKTKTKRKGKTKGEDTSAEEHGLRTLQRARQPKIEFVWVSFDVDPSDVDAFRRDHWSMPWTHAFVGKDNREVMQHMGFSGIPTAILVDEQGDIVEVGASLRGEQLQPTLERVLSERANAPRG